jgi:hypothetical protein
MSRSGELVFFQEVGLFRPETQLWPLLNLSGASDCISVYRSLEEDRTWQSYLRDDCDYCVPEELVGESLMLSQVAPLFAQGRTLRINIGECPLSTRVYQAIWTNIAIDIRGEFIPRVMCVTIGEHDIIASDRVPEGSLIARAFMSVSFCGYGVAIDCESMREQVLRLHEIAIVRRSLESVAGPLDVSVHWSI